jgi:NAD(P)-dependent dehydrogenase (short-subunit alcohol dehydrogenase family)
MVLLSSKSGLEPSKANSVYNATKAGELHLARGWALELGKDGIRVNCIAPGNVFEGSKIWNPDYIKKAAEKKGIKPDEVIPYYNALTALGEEIKPQDIADAAVFLSSEHSRRMTGQVLVVDGGQVWTR